MTCSWMYSCQKLCFQANVQVNILKYKKINSFFPLLKSLINLKNVKCKQCSSSTFLFPKFDLYCYVNWICLYYIGINSLKFSFHTVYNFSISRHNFIYGIAHC